MNPLVEKIAAALYHARIGASRLTWARLPDHRREGYRETVREVLLAAMNAGLIIREYEKPDSSGSGNGSAKAADEEPSVPSI